MKTKKYKSSCKEIDCAVFVGLVMYYSGWDTDFLKGAGGPYVKQGLLPYLRKSSKWENVTGKIHSNKDALPGDIIITGDSGHHVALYAGDVFGNGKVIFEAAFCDTTANASPTQNIVKKVKEMKGYIFRKVRD
ncbi:MAG: hypothetical protein Q4F56_02730 [Candidatus Saccharibacteria bacterium]|nr:hypothetical protein [Candidatus Saccharibacteria bacterium]